MDNADEIKVFITNRESKCDDCGENLGRQAWITLQRDKGALCLTCADLDHLTFLPRGDTALTRRARKHSLLSAVVEIQPRQKTLRAPRSAGRGRSIGTS
jgi:hypothetical protein